MIKFPILKTGEYLICRKELSSKQILNNDDTYYNGSLDNYYMIFYSIEEIKDYIELKGNAGYRYDIYDSKGNYIDYLCLYDENIYIKIINSLLLEYGEQRVFENESFRVGELSSDSYLHLIYNRPKRVQFELRLSNFDIEMQIDRATEIFNMIADDNSINVFEKFITDLFTSKIKVEYIGKKSICIYFYDKRNEQIRELSYYEGILGLLPIRFGTREIYEYMPIITVDK